MSKNDLSWWKRKVLRRKLPIDPKNLFTMFQTNPYCYYCKISLNDIDIHIEHRCPISRGGNHENENIALSCEDCNYLKNNKTEKEFIGFLKEYCLRFAK